MIDKTSNKEDMYEKKDIDGSDVVEEKRLKTGENLKIIKIAKDESDDNPDNNLIIMISKDGYGEGIKFAPPVCDLLAPKIVGDIFKQIESREDFINLARKYVKDILSQDINWI